MPEHGGSAPVERPGRTGVAIATEERLRLVLIGAGRMAGEHARTFAAVDGVDIVGVASASGTSAEALAERHRIADAGADWRQLVESTGANGCIVATGHLQTAEITGAAIDLGLHVLVEKPVALDPEPVLALHERAAAAGVVAMVGMNRRFFRSVLAAVDTVRLHGPIVGVSLDAPDPVGIQRTQSSYDPEIYRRWTTANTLHAIDLLRVVAGEATEVTGWASTAEREVSRVALIRFDSGAIGTYTSHGVTGGRWQLRIDGDGVAAVLDPIEHGRVRIGGAWSDLPSDDTGLKYGTHGQAEAFRAAVRTGIMTPPACDLADHARSLALAAAIEGLEVAR